MIALYPGAYKPPHKGHFEVVRGLLNGTHGGHVYDYDSAFSTGQKALSREKSEVEKIDKVIVFIGGGERNGITKEESMFIWKIYAKHLPGVEIMDGEKNPMFAAKDYAKAHPNENFYAVTGVRDESDLKDLRRITTFKNRENVQGLVLPPAKGAEVRATDLRTAVLNGSLDDVTNFFPKELTREELLTILKILKDNIIAEIVGLKLDTIVDSVLQPNFTPTIKEGTNGASIAPQQPVRSVDRERLAMLYDYIKNLLPQGTFITMGNNAINIGYEQLTPNDLSEDNQPSDLTKYIASILEYMIDEGMNIQPLPEVKVKRDKVNAESFFGKTAYYNPELKEIVLYVEGRHPKDICRSFTHEMIHHIQNLEGRLNNITTSNTNEDNNLLEIEKEAYLQGNITFRNWEDKIKNSPTSEDVDGKKAFSREIQQSN